MRRSALQTAAILVLAAAPAAAQQSLDAGGRVYGLVGGGFGDGPFVATGAGAGLRLTPHLGLDVELTHLSGANVAGAPPHGYGGISIASTFAVAGASVEDFPAFPVGFEPWFPSIRIEDQQRDVTTFLTRFTVEFPVANGRLFPYLTGGGGVGRVTERFSVVVDPFPWIPLAPVGTEPVQHPSDGINAVQFFDSSVFPSPDEYSELGLSLVLGGGVDVRLWRGLGVGVDVRWLRILRSYDAFDTALVTSRVSYRF
ncbi:MAG: outer membrane beta-barrel protein [Acidobacteria bacterium]|nr:outer membrane beta-barrel protein [Acidobacteriota bacterium]